MTAPCHGVAEGEDGLLDERYALGLKSAAGGCSLSPEGTLFKAQRLLLKAFGRSSWKL